MLKNLFDYVNILVIVSIIASLIMTVAPKGSTKAIIGIISASAVVLILLKPLTSLGNLDINALLGQFSAEYTIEKIDFEQNDLLKELIADKTSAYILAKAQALGLDCKVSVIVGGDTIHSPQTIEITILSTPDEAALKQLDAFIAFDIGISQENRHYIMNE
jgi:stage III sporulation protein AF